MRITKKRLKEQIEMLQQEIKRQEVIRQQLDDENYKLYKQLKEKEDLEAYKTMLPTSIYDNKVYNILLEWIQLCKVSGIAIKVDNSEKIIHVWTTKPGVLIGKQGKTIEEVENKIHLLKFYEDYKIRLYEITMLISKTDKKVTDEEHQKNWEALVRYRLGPFEE